jgi:hypothetical protein
MRRREFITLIGGAAAAWPLAARAQEPSRTYRIGFLIRAPRNTPFADAAFDELRVNGFIDGQNLIVLPGGFDDPNEVVAERAAALVKAGPDVIIAGPDGPIRALQAVTQTVPIVGMTEDMVAAGLVSSLAHLRPFAEVTANRRQHDLILDRFGLERDSDGYTAKAGATLNLAGTLAGDFAVGYLNQMYRAPLPNVGGYLVEAALVWEATALTTGRLFASTTAAESPLFLTSAVLTRQLGVEVSQFVVKKKIPEKIPKNYESRLQMKNRWGQDSAN